MPNDYGAPEISLQELRLKLSQKQEMVLLDVREAWELQLARLEDERTFAAPVSEVSRQGMHALPAAAQDKEAEIVVVCHHGVRSAAVTAWLLAQGWKNVRSLAGGLEDYASFVDPSIGRY